MSDDASSPEAETPVAKPEVTLNGRKFRLRFDFRAADELAGVGINIYNPDTYIEMTPRHVASLVWAGQLHEKKRLTRPEVVAALSLDPDDFMGVATAVTVAIAEALGGKKKKSTREA